MPEKRPPKLDTLFYGDCLDWMRQWESGSIDLIYLDPPFNSKTDYKILFRNGSEGEASKSPPIQNVAFVDTWRWGADAQTRLTGLTRRSGGRTLAQERVSRAIAGLYHTLGHSGMIAYLSYMAERLLECQRVLKPTGSIYLHCDPTASHYLKVLMDAVFGADMFRNEIVWRIGWVSGYKTQKRGWIRNHDTLLYYVKSKRAANKFNKEYIPYADGYTRRDGSIPKGKGIPIEDTWNCHAADELHSIMIMSFSKEKLGYPTQKPVKLLERIIKASSNPGEVVLDPFCGCGTTIAAAHKLGRKFLGIDISAFAIDLIQARMKRRFFQKVSAEGIPLDLRAAKKLAREDPFGFESWALTRILGMVPTVRQRRDCGVDGRGTMLHELEWESGRVIAQVKGGKIVAGHVRDFLKELDRENASLGIFVTLDSKPSAAMQAEAARLGSLKVGASIYPRVQFWSIEDHFYGRKPDLPDLLDPITAAPMTKGLAEMLSV